MIGRVRAFAAGSAEVPRLVSLHTQVYLTAGVGLTGLDAAAQAYSAQLQGDWQAERRSQPESLGLQWAEARMPAGVAVTGVSRVSITRTGKQSQFNTSSYGPLSRQLRSPRRVGGPFTRDVVSRHGRNTPRSWRVC